MSQHTFKPNWTMEKIEKFIDLYKNHECLWNPDLETYKNAQTKQAAYADIVAQMRMPGLTLTAAKDRIKSMRTMYRRELNKVIKSATTETNSRYVYKPKLFWFEQIDTFLRPIAISRMDAVTLACPTLTTSQNSEVNEDSDDNISIQEHRADHTFQISADEDLTEDNCLTLIEDQRPTVINTSIEKSYKKRKRPIANDLYVMPETPSNSNFSSEENEFDIFGKFISAQLNKLPLITALQCQQKIQDLLTSKRIEILEYNNTQRSENVGEISRVTSPFSGFIDLDYDEKPTIHNNQERDK